ncbi:hypothetical protein, partial [Actinomadura harenae]
AWTTSAGPAADGRHPRRAEPVPAAPTPAPAAPAPPGDSARNCVDELRGDLEASRDDPSPDTAAFNKFGVLTHGKVDKNKLAAVLKNKCGITIPVMTIATLLERTCKLGPKLFQGSDASFFHRLMKCAEENLGKVGG